MKTLLIALGLFAITPIYADTYVYEAITDFENLTEGEVPYYIDRGNGRNALAINAAVEEYRDKFAHASILFDGPSGLYDVTITSLGEIDGEGEYQLLINGNIAGSAINSRTQTDWIEQNHLFDDVVIQSGDVVAVQSKAVSNGLIPENDEFAFARGRWRTLELVFDDLATSVATSVDLAVSIDTVSNTVDIGQTLEYTISATNNHTQTTATGVEVNVTLPDNIAFASGNECSLSALNSVVVCLLPQIQPGEAHTISFEGSALAAGDAVVLASVDAAQTETDNSDNTAARTLEITDATTGSTDSGAVTEQETESDNPISTGGETATSGQTDSPTATSVSGGGGKTSLLLLWLLALYGYSRPTINHRE